MHTSSIAVSSTHWRGKKKLQNRGTLSFNMDDDEDDDDPPCE